MSEADPVAETLLEPPDIEPVVTRVRAGDVLVELRHDRIERRAAMLDALLTRVVDSDTKVIWTGNPLRSPLTLERLFLQAVGPEADLRFERTPADLAAMLQRVGQAATRVLLIVQQPETLDAQARDTLSRIAPLLADAAPPVQFLFCCGGAFKPIRPAPPRRAALAVMELAELPAALEPTSSSREKLPLLLLLLIATLGGLLTTSAPLPSRAPPLEPVQATAAPPDLPSVQAVTPAADDRPSTTGVPALAPPALAAGPSAPAAPVDPPAPPVVNPTDPRTDVGALRREFDAFLAQQTPRVSNLSQEQRDALFDEFLERHYRHTGNSKL